MANRISHSAIRMYSECGRKYKYHYVNRLRSKTTSGALLFGSSLDHALNEMLKSRSLEDSITAFNKSFAYQNINNEGVYLPYTTLVTYSKKDFDAEILTEEDHQKYLEYKAKFNVDRDTVAALYNENQFLKEEGGFNKLTNDQKRNLNFANWLCLRRKGLIMLRDYHKNTLPQIKEVLAIQKTIEMDNGIGDKLTGFLDLIVEFNDGKRYLLDHKTSSIQYEDDSAMRSQQLIIYYHAFKEEFKLDGAGFIVFNKGLFKNKTKICSVCSKDGTGQRHKTCDAEVEGKRCNGEWISTVNPECKIDVILNKISTAAESLVIETFDEANEGIKKGVFNPNLNACGNENFRCPFYNKCWHGKDDDLINLGEKKEEKK